MEDNHFYFLQDFTVQGYFKVEDDLTFLKANCIIHGQALPGLLRILDVEINKVLDEHDAIIPEKDITPKLYYQIARRAIGKFNKH
jgi:hypothetical protein